MLELADAANRAGRDAVQAAYVGDWATFQTEMEELEAESSEASRIAADLGAGECAEPVFE